MKKSLIGGLAAFTGMVIGAGMTGHGMGKMIVKKEQMSEKHLGLFLLMNQWVKVKQEGGSLASFFKRNGYKQIAIYGMSYAGETLVNELKDSGIEIKYGIDKNAANLYAEIDIMTPDDELKEVDAIVVTSISFFDEIEEQLSAKCSCPIVSLEDIVYEV